ncbi:MAG: BMP family lipoprotein [Weissella confusa]
MKRNLIIGVAATTLIAVVAGMMMTSRPTEAQTEPIQATVAMITDGAGVDDQSYQELAWRGVKKYALETGLAEGIDGYQSFHAVTATEARSAISDAVNDGFKTIFAVGYRKINAVDEAVQKYPDRDFVMVGDVAQTRPNVASVTFQANQSSYLAGVAAAKTTKTNTIGLVSGEKSVVMEAFEAGYIAGAKSINPEIQILHDYVGDFKNDATAKTLANNMYQAGADVVYQTAGGAGQGVFEAARSINEKRRSADKVWVIGVDTNQSQSGRYQALDASSNFTLTSVLKRMDQVVYDIANLAMKDKFPGGEHLVYGLANDGVSVTRGRMSTEAWMAVQDAKTAILDKQVVVPETLD